MLHAVVKRAHLQQEMEAEHKVASAVRAANRRAEAQLLQARQVSHTSNGHLWTAAQVVLARLSLEQTASATIYLGQERRSIASH